MGNIKASRWAVIALAVIMVFASSGCGRNYEYSTGDLEWWSTYTKDKSISDTYYYSDDWFKDDPSSVNNELALASMQLVASAVTNDEDGYSAAFLKNLGFDEIGFSDFESSDPDDCNYTRGRKTVGEGDSAFTLVAVAIQSSSHNAATKNKGWRQNFTVNDENSSEPAGEHYAYAKAVDKVIDDIAALGGSGSVRFWITGQSRGGAIANVLSAKLPEKIGSEDAKVFAYTFEAPATVDEETASAAKCAYIHNYVCEDDFVTKIPMWGMTRYGDTQELKTKETDEGLKDELAKLGSDAADLNARIVVRDQVSALTEKLEQKIPTRADYSKVRTDKWTDADGKDHELTYSYQEAFVKLMDVVFRKDGGENPIRGLVSKKDAVKDLVDVLADGIKKEQSGDDPSAEYWEGTVILYDALKDSYDSDLGFEKEDLYKIVTVGAPVLIDLPDGSGEPSIELLTSLVAYKEEMTYSHMFDTIIARLKILAPDPK